jgi:hypothetical protein
MNADTVGDMGTLSTIVIVGGMAFGVVLAIVGRWRHWLLLVVGVQHLLDGNGSRVVAAITLGAGIASIFAVARGGRILWNAYRDGVFDEKP